MGFSGELNLLRQRLQSGELTPEQYEEKKRSLQQKSVTRAQNFLAKTGEASRMRLALVCGTVRDGGIRESFPDVDFSRPAGFQCLAGELRSFDHNSFRVNLSDAAVTPMPTPASKSPYLVLRSKTPYI